MKIEQFNVDFDCNEMTPFFQSEPNNRIRFDIDKLGKNMMQDIINKIYDKNEEIEMIFISEYITSGKRISSNSKIGKVITIRNWEEFPSLDEEPNVGAVYVKVKRLDRNNVFDYCFAIKRGHREAYISFFSDTFLLYVSSDVIDIISNNESEISKLKEKYVELYDRYYEE